MQGHLNWAPNRGEVDYKIAVQHLFIGHLSRTTWVSRYQSGKTNLDFTEARDSEWQCISWTICNSPPHSRQI